MITWSASKHNSFLKEHSCIKKETDLWLQKPFIAPEGIQRAVNILNSTAHWSGRRGNALVAKSCNFIFQEADFILQRQDLRFLEKKE